MTDGVCLSNSISELAEVWHQLTGLSFTGVFTSEQEQTNPAGEGEVITTIENASCAFSHFSAVYTNQNILLSAGSVESARSPIVSDLIKRFTYPLIHKVGTPIQFGGGVGGGYQVYCDGHLVVTSGGGCGGGLSFDGVKHLSMGGGCGGGIQLSKGFGFGSFNFTNDTAAFYTIGGGGGCGSCMQTGADTTRGDVTPDSKSAGLASHIVCGDAADANALPISNFRSIAQSQYTQTNFQKLCERVTVAGGGGGGGGFTDSAGEVVGAGFGYSFYLTTSTDDVNRKNSLHGDVHSIVRRVSGEEFLQLSNHYTATDGEKNTFAPNDVTPYETFSRLVQDSVARCGGASDWVCICQTAREKLSYCAHRAKNTHGVPSPSSAPEESNRDIHCDTINRFNATFTSMLQNSCPNAASVGGSFGNGSGSATLGADMCPSSNVSDVSVMSMLDPSTPWTVTIHNRSNSTSAKVMANIALQLANTAVGGEPAELAELLGLSLPSRGYEQSNAFTLFELFAACTVVFMVVVAWLKVFGVRTHRYARILDAPDLV